MLPLLRFTGPYVRLMDVVMIIWKWWSRRLSGEGVDMGKNRVLLAKLGLDAHDIGIKAVARWLRDAGMEVIYTGPFQTPEKIVSTAIQEGVDVIGLSFSGGEHLIYTRRVIDVMKENGIDVPIVVGGIIPKQDMPTLKKMGARDVFAAGTPSTKMLDFFRIVLEKT